MNSKGSIPGVSRPDRLSEEGLARLNKQLDSGTKVITIVLEQWVRHYGILVRPILVKFDCWDKHLDSMLIDGSDAYRSVFKSVAFKSAKFRTIITTTAMHSKYLIHWTRY